MMAKCKVNLCDFIEYAHTLKKIIEDERVDVPKLNELLEFERHY